MGKRIIVQARGKGSNTYKVRRKAYNIRLKYLKKLEGEGEVRKLLDSGGHSAPIAKIVGSSGVFHIPAFKGMVEGQKINLSSTG
ncbi:MAG: 50S ribosomal protein L2, partial [Nanoarchaeota archaeon]|nr:50S ribosomal protein L2 [Nanoarchaeota archaeon]